MVETNRAFVAGWPIKHSRSPLIHGHWLDHFNIAGSYTQLPVEPNNFEQFLTNLPEGPYIGGNVTIPFKEQACKLIDNLDETAKRIGAVNTVWCRDGEVFGSNTDCYGFLTNLDEMNPGWDNSEARKRGALILGAGGASRAVVDSIHQRGFESIIIANRTLQRAEHLRDDLAPGARVVAYEEIGNDVYDVAFIVNTTSVGMGDGEAPVSLEGFRCDTIVNDIIYAPLETPLLRDARQRGMTATDGLGMLLHQAVPGFEKWFGTRPDVTEQLRKIILQDLGELQ